MAFDWPRFLDANRIEYIDRGPSTAKGNVYVHCPFCGEADQGNHMGVSLYGKGWGCWRTDSHRGIAPHRLIQALIGCSWAEAERIAGSRKQVTTGDGDLLNQVSALVGIPAAAGQFEPALEQPGSRITSKCRPLWEYLHKLRGFLEYTDEVIGRFKLTGSLDGPWRYRVIFPVQDWDRSLISWTGRSVVTGAEPRYRSLTVEAEKAIAGQVARQPISDCLLRLPELAKGGRLLVIAEGPLDAAKLSLHERENEAVATCLFGKRISTGQLDLLAQLRSRFDHIALLLDPDASMDAIALESGASFLGISSVRMRGHDAGEMKSPQIRGLYSRINRRMESSP